MRHAAIFLSACLVISGCGRGDAPPSGDRPSPSAAEQAAAGCGHEVIITSQVPHEVSVRLLMGYSGVVPEIQKCFDHFSWQSFVALNHAANGSFDDFTSPRVWEEYVAPDVLFGLTADGPAAGVKVLSLMSKHDRDAAPVAPGVPFIEATGQPLVDQNGNFAVFEVRVNPDEEAYIRDNDLTTATGQEGKVIDFPAGDEARVGAIEIKAAWRIMNEGEDLSRFYHRTATLRVDASESATGEPFEVEHEVALVGLHILHKTANFRDWIWSTWVHDDVAPTQGGGDPVRPWLFNDPGCGDCPPNVPPEKGDGYTWQPSEPYASAYDITQVVQQVPTPAYTEEVNALWRALLQGTPWAHYRLIGSQWVGGEGERVDIPDVVANTTLETYIQGAGCLSCHVHAKTAVDTDADKSFLLRLAKR